MPHDPSLDPHAILKILGVQTIHAIAPVAGGADTAIWRVEHDQITSALRVFRASQAATYLREVRAMELAAQQGIPVPRVRAQAHWHDRPTLLLSWCAGQPLAATLQRQPWRLLRQGRAFGRMQARIHQITVPAPTDVLAADWISWHNTVDAGLAAQLRERAGHTPQLLHLDYHPLNVLMGDRDVTAVLDWANARAGDPRADVARTYAILAVMPHQAAREPLPYRVARRLLAHTWMSGYRAVAGELKDMPLFFAWAGAVMVADLAQRITEPNSWWLNKHMQLVERWTYQSRKRSADATA